MLELIYNSAEDIPEGFDSLYTEKDGKWHLTGVKGMKTSQDTDKLSKSLREERAAHKATKDKLAKFGEDPDIDAILEKLDGYEDLEARLEAGEGGKMGREEIEVITPVIERLKAEGLVDVTVTVPQQFVDRLQTYCARLRKEAKKTSKK